MTRVLVDSSAYSAFFRGHAGVVEAIQRAEELILTPIVLGELRAGFFGGGRAKANEDELESFLESPRARVEPIGEETAARWARILHGLRRRGAPLPTNDVWIAASAWEHGLHVLTTDRDFLRIPEIVADWFDPAS